MTTGIKAGVISADAVETAAIKDANVTTAKLATNAVTAVKITDATITAAKFAAGAITLPINYIGGLKLSNDTDTDHDVNITAGAARDSTNVKDITLSSEITKRIDAAWAVGDDAGGLDGSESVGGTPDASTMYYVWLILRTDTGVVDALFSESSTAPTMPTNYDYKRLIGCVKTNSSANVVLFTHGGGDLFIYTGGLQADVSAAAVTHGAEVTGVTLSAPAGANCLVYLQGVNSGHNHIYIYLYATGGAETASETNSILGIQGASNIGSIAGQASVLLDASKQCSYRMSEGGGTGTLSIYTYGFHMLTRSDP